MRIWHPIPPICLDRKRLCAEHKELHAIWTVLVQKRNGYSRHPETKRWKGHLPALFWRHQALVAEMGARGYKHNSPLDTEFAPRIARADLEWPEPWEPVAVMREKLTGKLGL